MLFVGGPIDGEERELPPDTKFWLVQVKPKRLAFLPSELVDLPPAAPYVTVTYQRYDDVMVAFD
jgi:hypothetical protein